MKETKETTEIIQQAESEADTHCSCGLESCSRKRSFVAGYISGALSKSPLPQQELLEESRREVMELQAEIDRLKAELEWIDIENELPTIGEKVRIMLNDGSTMLNTRTIFNWHRPFHGKKATHWQPLPSPNTLTNE